MRSETNSESLHPKKDSQSKPSVQLCPQTGAWSGNHRPQNHRPHLHCQTACCHLACSSSVELWWKHEEHVKKFKKINFECQSWSIFAFSFNMDVCWSWLDPESSSKRLFVKFVGGCSGLLVVSSSSSASESNTMCLLLFAFTASWKTSC